MNSGIDHGEVERRARHRRLEERLSRGLGLRDPGLRAPEGYEQWVQALFPSHARWPLVERHHDVWRWAEALEHGTGTRPLIAVWPRGGGKTTTAEMVAVYLGATGRRRYCWYVSETQQKANNNLRNLAAMLESPAFARHYPAHADRLVSKYGHSRGWSVSRLRTAGGFTVDAIGLDTAQRGLKVEDQRPDLIILDDLDGKHDTLATTAKKRATVTTSILPAGSRTLAVLGVQNLITRDGLFTELAENRADWLTKRRRSGPHPAVEGLAYAGREEADGVKRAVITGGEATWPGQDLEACQHQIDVYGLSAFLKECQHLVRELQEGLVIRFDESKHSQIWSDEEIRHGIETGGLVPFAGIDYGHWRFAFLLFVVDRSGRVHVIDEYFSQRETLSLRAEAIDALLAKYGIKRLKVYGDPANPQDALELNAALDRGWGDEAPSWRVTAANLNLNRDYVKADAIEMQAWLRTWVAWQPDLFFDNHTTDGTDHQFPLG